MVAAIRQTVTVRADGAIEIRSPELRPGEKADVIVLLAHGAAAAQAHPHGAWRRHAGAIDSGDPRAAENQKIDADLARGYAATDLPEP